MAKYLRPRRGTKTNANGQNILLKRGEIFLEFPDTTIGNQAGRLIVGDGSTSYSSIKPFIEDPSLYCPRFTNTSVPSQGDYRAQTTAALNKLGNLTSSNTVTLSNDIGAIKEALCYETGTMEGIVNVLSTKASSSTVTTSSNGLLPKLNGSTLNYFRADGTWATPPNDNTTYDIATTNNYGLVPQLPANATSVTKYLRSDATWQVPPDTVYYFPNSTRSGLCRKFDGTNYRFLRADNTWVTPPNDNTTYPMSDDYESTGVGTMFTSQGIRDFLVELSETETGSGNNPFAIFYWHGGAPYVQIGPNATTTTWVKSVYQPSDGLTLIGGRLEENNYHNTRYGKAVPVTVAVNTNSSGEYGLTFAFKNTSSTDPANLQFTVTEIYLRDAIS